MEVRRFCIALPLGPVVEAVLASVLMVGLAWAGAAAPPPSHPGAPAVHTGNVGAVRNIKGSGFDYVPVLDPIAVELADCVCPDADAAHRAQFLMTEVLETEPVWLFPCGPVKVGTSVRARVWTRKGWLSEVLMGANLAARRKDRAAVVFEPAPRPEAKGLPPPLPGGAAFASTLKVLGDGASLEATHEGKARAIRLWDVKPEPGAKAEQAAKRALGDERVWLFPCSRRKVTPPAPLPVRVWTREGWLSDVLEKAGCATRYADPEKAEVASAAGHEPGSGEPSSRPGAPPATPRPRPPSQPDRKKIVWHEVPISVGSSDAHSVETAPFELPVGLWRLTWDLKRVMKRCSIVINVNWIDPELSEVTRSGKPAQTFGTDRGQGFVRYKPGKYFLRITGANKLNVKVEYPEMVPE